MRLTVYRTTTPFVDTALTGKRDPLFISAGCSFIASGFRASSCVSLTPARSHPLYQADLATPLVSIRWVLLLSDQHESHGSNAFVLNFEIARHRCSADLERYQLWKKSLLDS
jgi:hypothetical protein